MQQKQAVQAFAALGQDTRLRIIATLGRSGADGLSAGALAEALGVSPSNLTFHLKELESAGLVTARRRARHIFYAADQAALGTLVKFMFENLQATPPRVRVRIE